MLKSDSILILLTSIFQITQICFLGSLLALGIGAASFASHAGAGNGNGKWGLGTGTGTGNGNGESEQRYSGKPDGFAGTPTLIHNA